MTQYSPALKVEYVHFSYINAPAEITRSTTMKKNSNKSPFPWTSVSVLLFTAAVLTGIIIIYAAGQKQRILNDAATEMEAVAA